MSILKLVKPNPIGTLTNHNSSTNKYLNKKDTKYHQFQLFQIELIIFKSQNIQDKMRF